MGLFSEKPRLSRRELRKELGRADSGGKFSRQERERLEGEIFTRRPGGSISEQDYRRALKDLRNAERKATGQERLDLHKKRRLLEDLKKAA